MSHTHEAVHHMHHVSPVGEADDGTWVKHTHLQHVLPVHLPAELIGNHMRNHRLKTQPPQKACRMKPLRPGHPLEAF